MLESIIRDQVQQFLDENKLIYPSQHGFTKGKSCHLSLDIIYLDFSKAFDKVPHKRLMGFRGMS